MRIQHAPLAAQQPQPRPSPTREVEPPALRAGGGTDHVVTFSLGAERFRAGAEAGSPAILDAVLLLLARVPEVGEEVSRAVRLLRYLPTGDVEDGTLVGLTRPGAGAPARRRDVGAPAARVTVHDLTSTRLSDATISRRSEDVASVTIGAPTLAVDLSGAPGLRIGARPRTLVSVSLAPWLSVNPLVAALGTHEGEL
jgi:hypothetical protein